MKCWLLRFHRNEVAVTAIEYALIAALIAGIIVVGLTAVSSRIGQIYTFIEDNVVRAVQ